MAEISSENLKRRGKIPQTGDEIEELAHTFNGLLDRLRTHLPESVSLSAILLMS